MPIRCPKCGQKYDVVRFGPERSLKCTCGNLLDISMYETFDDFLRYCENQEELQKAQEIQKDAGYICQMILNEESLPIDIEIAIKNLEEKVSRYFPDKMEVYRMIYEARFNRLWDQFRGPTPD